MKKRLAYCFIIVATIILQSHAIIPHHHQHHDHDHEDKKSTNCHFNQPVVLTFQQSKIVVIPNEFSAKGFHNFQFEFINNENFKLFIHYKTIQFKENPKFLYTQLSRILIKWRGPPSI